MRKRTFLAILFFFTCGFQARAQNTSRCSSAEYLQEQLLDPDFAQRRQSIEDRSQQWIQDNGNAARISIGIPVVFHILYNTAEQNIPDSVIYSQLDVINEDYQRLNSDSTQSPLAFRPLAANCEIYFCLAQRTPGNQTTSGIIRKFTPDTAFSNQYNIKFSSMGGDDAWDASKYLNVWVGAFTSSTFLGLGTFPGTDPDEDGVVMNYKACGRVGNHLLAHYNRGRTLTHEIGHWLNLLHIWGDDGGTCAMDDQVNDTPMQLSETYGCPSYPRFDNCTNSFPGVMFMNFMDYTDDVCMNMFSNGQKQRMLAALNVDRSSLLTSLGCTPVGIEKNELGRFIRVYPNPATENLFVRVDLPGQDKLWMSLLDISGRTVYARDESVANGAISIPLQSFQTGIYQLVIRAGEGIAHERISIVRD